MYVHNSKATAEILLKKAVEGRMIWSNETVKGLLQDVITLHDEVEHIRRVAEDHRAEVSKLRRAQTVARRGW